MCARLKKFSKVWSVRVQTLAVIHDNALTAQISCQCLVCWLTPLLLDTSSPRTHKASPSTTVDFVGVPTAESGLINLRT